MSRAATLFFAIFAYAVFFATFLYLIGFVGNFLVPFTVDNGPDSPMGAAVVVDLILISLFGLQHSVMARQGFKRAWTRIVPTQAERSVYVLIASLTLVVLMLFWRPIEGTVWDATGSAIEKILWLGFVLGWGIVLLSTFLLNHFELFGLQQAWFHVQGKTAAEPQMRKPLFYRWVRHPLYSGFFLAFWSIPVMTYGHLLLAAGLSVYMLIAIQYEERDLVGMFGKDYEDYRHEAGMLTPKMRAESKPNL